MPELIKRVSLLFLSACMEITGSDRYTRFVNHIAPLIKGNIVHFINLHMTRRRHRLFSFSLCVHRRQQQQSTKTREEAKRGEREEFGLRGGHGRKHERANRGTKEELENDDDDDEEDGIFPREEQKEWRR